jgi:hypothetical protein
MGWTTGWTVRLLVACAAEWLNAVAVLPGECVERGRCWFDLVGPAAGAWRAWKTGKTRAFSVLPGTG